MKGELQYGMIDGCEICVHLSDNASNYLIKSGNPLYIGMELYFTYFMQKKVRFFDEKPERDLYKISKYIYLYFAPLETRPTKIRDLMGDESDLMEFPVKRKGALIPKFVRIERKKNIWSGDFTWKSGNKNFKPLPHYQIKPKP